ncbi:beta-1,3-galactosyl-O-glycosyl-glycoprotein beta-1,6-N-acetylglucosaminyltransferase-like [Mugil cephalus]|uniref:beta-1,3-galactosyl-O-glycosyl-glycoprotein beta-1,6-N-acetylglucosaminyltransferase-like n=1 Tax=Mugil cephalus TaxID=48193 RepID=UPI001FB6140B|nr:beta-1,3-galactosyl-O-glycosyl-glycoprotein beta-1,6-N-acetylglucosaminyltransferase-like [Mugil cephalus]XP_047446979.1 beta-1,3-galactosyl-O-glycosyl-glycoprotein beta-1,6-N-acetylglucosaminyltransferase-like [Mugil cephalus]
MMRSLKQRRLLLKLTCVLGLLLMLLLLCRPKTDQSPAHTLRHEHRAVKQTYNCPAILKGEREALDEAKLLSISKEFRRSTKIPDAYYINATQNCRNFKSSRKYVTSPLSKEEEDFPLAYSIVVHHKVQNFEHLLRAIYAPQNIYCVHVDKKSEASVISAITAIVSCFPNVFMVSEPVSVVYAAWPRVQADLNCMADLYNSSTKWKYFLNLCGQDFPLKTNLEIVRILRFLKGGNSMESETMVEGKRWRVTQVHQIVNGTIQGTGKKKEPPPFNLPILSGNAYFVANQGYIQSVLEDKRIHALIEWAKDTYSPDEFLWATIQRMPGVPGSRRPHSKYDTTDMSSIARLVRWPWHEGSQDSLEAVYPPCQGDHVRSICVNSAGDLQWLLQQYHLFANKFDIDTDPIAVYCLERYLRQKALAEVH